MHIDKLIDALSRLGIAELRSETHHAHGTAYLLEGRLPTPPFARRRALIAYEIRLNSGSVFVEPDDIDSMLFHLWQGQYDIRDLQRAGDLGGVAQSAR